jgi:hypothetical protein
MWVPVDAKVGDRMILQDGYDKMPQKTNVIRTTKTLIFVDGYLKGLWKNRHRDSYEHRTEEYPYYHYAYPYTQETWDDLVRAVNQRKEARRLKELEKEEELEEVKAACGNQLPIKERKDLPDGSRLYTLDLPVDPCYIKRKKGFEILIVRCWEIRQMWRWKENDKVQARFSYHNGQCTRFPECTLYGETDEEVLWKCCRNAYYSWW